MSMIPEGFPYELSDEELRQAITATIAGTRSGVWPPSSVFPDEPYHLIQLGLVEQSRRELHASSVITRFALAVAVISLLVALIVALVQ
jgi:hypothetical protein